MQRLSQRKTTPPSPISGNEKADLHYNHGNNNWCTWASSCDGQAVASQGQKMLMLSSRPPVLRPGPTCSELGWNCPAKALAIAPLLSLGATGMENRAGNLPRMRQYDVAVVQASIANQGERPSERHFGKGLRSAGHRCLNHWRLATRLASLSCVRPAGSVEVLEGKAQLAVLRQPLQSRERPARGLGRLADE